MLLFSLLLLQDKPLVRSLVLLSAEVISHTNCAAHYLILIGIKGYWLLLSVRQIFSLTCEAAFTINNGIFKRKPLFLLMHVVLLVNSSFGIAFSIRNKILSGVISLSMAKNTISTKSANVD